MASRHFAGVIEAEVISVARRVEEVLSREDGCYAGVDGMMMGEIIGKDDGFRVN